MRVVTLVTILAVTVLPTGAQNRSASTPSQMKLEIVEASLQKDRIVVVLEPEDAYGHLTVSYERKEGPAFILYRGNQWGGTYILSFNFATLPIGEFTKVSADWTPVRGPLPPLSQTPPPIPLNPPPATSHLPETLREVLRDHAIDSPPDGMLNMDQPVNRLAFEDSPELFVVAYYSPGSSYASELLQVRALNKASRLWSSGTFPESIGAPDAIRHTNNRIYVTGHQSPSAEDTLVLTTSVVPVTTLHGWILLLRPDDTVFYFHSMVHFAPTHPGEVWVFEPKSARDQRLYPNEPYGPIRLAYIEKVRKLYNALGEKWFAEHNHHEDPTLFDVSFGPTFNTSEDGTLLAFSAHFRAAVGDLSVPKENVLIVCRNSTQAVPQCKERSMDEAKREHPTWSEPQILEDAIR